MKLAASDYDGTLFRHQKIDPADIRSIHAWRTAGHVFGPVSGRDYGMLIPQFHHYGIEYDFAVCNNGGIIYDGAGKVRYQGEIPNQTLAELIQEEAVRESFHFAFSAADCTYLCHGNENSWIRREGKEWDFPVHDIEEAAVGKLPRIHQLSLGFPKPADSVRAAEVLNARYGEVIHAFPNGQSLDVTPADVSKAGGLSRLAELMGWDAPVFYVIGDESNDLPMIEAFGGFVVNTAREEIQQKARRVFPSVGAMLDCYR